MHLLLDTRNSESNYQKYFFSLEEITSIFSGYFLINFENDILKIFIQRVLKIASLINPSTEILY